MVPVMMKCHELSWQLLQHLAFIEFFRARKAALSWKASLKHTNMRTMKQLLTMTAELHEPNSCVHMWSTWRFSKMTVVHLRLFVNFSIPIGSMYGIFTYGILWDCNILLAKIYGCLHFFRLVLCKICFEDSGFSLFPDASPIMFVRNGDFYS